MSDNERRLLETSFRYYLEQSPVEVAEGCTEQLSITDLFAWCHEATEQDTRSIPDPVKAWEGAAVMVNGKRIGHVEAIEWAPDALEVRCKLP